MPTTQVGWHAIYYDEYGAGQPVLLLAGLGASRLSWGKQIAPFSDKFRAINMDNRDAGDSALGTGPYTIIDMAEDTAGLIRNLRLGPTHLVGISMGGCISLELAIRHPELVDRLVLVSTTVSGPSINLTRPVKLTGDEAIEAQTRLFFSAVVGKGFMSAHPEELDEIAERILEKPMSFESYQRQHSALRTYNAADRLEKVTAPTLVIHGEADSLIPCVNGEYLAEHIKDARLSRYADVGHLPPLEAGEQFNHEVIEFLEWR